MWACPHLCLAPRPSARTIRRFCTVLEAYIETLKAENEILKRQLAAAEARAAREAAKAEWAIGEFSALTRRLRARAAERASRG